jgi:thiol-disulfide isomerase/thioredoxin
MLSRIALGVVLAGVIGLGIWSLSSRVSVTEPPPYGKTGSAGGPLRVHAAPIAVPDFRFEDGTGQPRTLADFRGRYVLLNVWATWCAPCREEMPALARLQKALGGPDFEVLALSIDSGGVPAVKQFFRETSVEGLGIYLDRSLQVNSALRVLGVPTTVLLDRRGRELARHVGPAEWDSAQAVQQIQRVMAAPSR